MDEYLSEIGDLDGDNSTMSTSCVALASNTSDLPLYLDIGVRAVNVVMADVFLLVGNFLNILTLTIIFRNKKLHNLSFGIAAQIAVCNIIKASVLGLPTIINNVTGRWVLGAHVCIICAFTRHLISTVRGMLFLIFALDRFSVVFFPFSYPRHSQRIVVTMCISSWMISLFLSLAPIPPLLNCYKLIEIIKDCFIIPMCCKTFATIWVHIVYFFSSTIAAGLFIALYIKGRKIRKEESKMLGLTKKTILDSDWRALKTIAVLFGSFLIVAFVPFLLAMIIEQFQEITIFILVSLMTIFINMVVITDPIVTLKNADAKQAYRKLCSDIQEALCCFCQT